MTKQSKGPVIWIRQDCRVVEKNKAKKVSTKVDKKADKKGDE